MGQGMSPSLKSTPVLEPEQLWPVSGMFSLLSMSKDCQSWDFRKGGWGQQWLAKRQHSLANSKTQQDRVHCRHFIFVNIVHSWSYESKVFGSGPAFRVTKHNSSLEKGTEDGGRAQNRPCQNSFRTRSNQAWKEDQVFFPQPNPNIHLVKLE